jgi:hypothetical protein
MPLRQDTGVVRACLGGTNVKCAWFVFRADGRDSVGMTEIYFAAWNL